MPVLYILMFLSGDTKGVDTWNAAGAFPAKAACEQTLKENPPTGWHVPPEPRCVRYHH